MVNYKSVNNQVSMHLKEKPLLSTFLFFSLGALYMEGGGIFIFLKSNDFLVKCRCFWTLTVHDFAFKHHNKVDF